MPKRIRAYCRALAAFSALIPALAPAAGAEPPPRFDGSVPATRAMAMGGAFAALGDDITALVYNPAGLVTSGGTVFGGAFSGSGEGEGPRSGSLAASHQRWSAVFAAAASQRRDPDETIEGLLVAGAARELIRGSAGSFLSAGAAVRAGRLSYDRESGCPLCEGTRVSQTAVAADAGLMIRPLPFISLAIAADNLFEAGFDAGGDTVPWDRTVRYGAAWLHEDRFTVSWERRHAGDDVTEHFGFGIRTALPLEIMAGFGADRVSGGARWDGGGWRAAAAFSQEEGGTIAAAVSLELFFDRPARIGQ